MSELSLYILISFLAFIIAAASTPVIIGLANRYTCLDYPSSRKHHAKPTPRWGGLVLALSIIPAILLADPSPTLLAYVGASCLILATGAVDDCKNLNWKIKLASIVLASCIVIFGAHTTIHYLGKYKPMLIFNIDKYSIPFTIFCIIGATNAINLIDGLNGLASGLSLVAFLFLGLAAALKGNAEVALISFGFLGAAGGFLLHNFPNARIFLGDSGSLLLGFTLAVQSIFLTQGETHSVEPLYPVLVLLIPLVDTIRVMLFRIILFKNPFLPDMNHIHHLAIKNYFTPKSAVLTLWAFSFLFGLFAYILLLIRRSSLPYLALILFFSFLLSVFAHAIGAERQKNDKTE